MKKLFSTIIVLGLLFCNVGFALTKSPIFKPNKNIDVKKLLNFNINKYTFDDYEKIIGKKFRKWDGKSGLSPFAVDYKNIDILFKNKKGVLSLQKTKNNKIVLILVIVEKTSCETLKSSIPAKFINKNNTIDFERDLLGSKTEIFKFSHDLPDDIRISADCLISYDTEEKKAISGLSFINVGSKEIFQKVISLKRIVCSFLTYERQDEFLPKYKEAPYNFDERQRSEGVTTLDKPIVNQFYINDTDSTLLKNSFWPYFTTTKYNKDIIIAEDKTPFKEGEPRVKKILYDKITVDRVTGAIERVVHRYTPTSEYTVSNTMKGTYYGSCEKQEMDERKF